MNDLWHVITQCIVSTSFVFLILFWLGNAFITYSCGGSYNDVVVIMIHVIAYLLIILFQLEILFEIKTQILK